ncbi:YczE/YyaS/YitT family protein [Lacticaseibacillus daqingensis]|uniref:YczE/YyaS/YitT family protein n=1 Tax=Lacticaseibacillus daqingensis TaxID=2486014 RepID=UPI000F76C65D|nr:hypothetical protein [Lacticaseibacillus daqingensis]
MHPRQMLLSLGFYLFTAVGISLTIIAAVGVSSFSALNVTLSTATGIQVGTLTTALNLTFMAACLALDPARSWRQYGLMTVALLLFGSCINFFTYVVFSPLAPHQYVARLALFLLGTAMGGFGTGRVLKYALLKFPIETWCSLMAARTRISFQRYRYGVDAGCVLLAIGLAWALHLPLTVREGTVLSFLMLSGMITLGRR